jgi:Ca2+-binding EF-hand superfamily protein
MACWWRRITPSPRPQESRGASRLTGLSQRREAAIEQALKAKIEQRRAAREAQAAADRRELEAFKEQFLNAAREVFALIDADGNGSLTKTEIVDAVTSDKKVISFLGSCGEPNLQFLLQPKRLEKALKVLDTSQDGEIDADEWEAAIYRGLEKRTADLKAEQERRAKAAAAADEEFSAEFLSAARKVFEMIDVDNSGTLTKQEIITAVKENKEVKMFLANCGNENLQYLLVPSRLNHALSVLDKDGDDEIDANEWCVSRSLRRRGAFDAATEGWGRRRTPRPRERRRGSPVVPHTGRTPSPKPSRRS